MYTQLCTVNILTTYHHITNCTGQSIGYFALYKAIHVLLSRLVQTVT